MKKIFIVSSLSLLLFTACDTPPSIMPSTAIKPNSMSQVIKLRYEEEKKELVVTAQFLNNGYVKETYFLEKPSQILLNGKEGILDTIFWTGVMYKWIFGKAQSNGAYNLTYINNTDTLKNMFEFNGFELTKPIPNSIDKSKNLVLYLKGLPDNKSIDIALKDWNTRGLDTSFYVKTFNNTVTINAEVFKMFNKGNIEINIAYRTEDTLLQQRNPKSYVAYYYELTKRTLTLQ